MTFKEKPCNFFERLTYEYAITCISFAFAFLISIFLNYNGLRFNGDAYYPTLSAIFQGLFSILALAGVFIVFKTEQLTRDIDKYDQDIRFYLQKMMDYSDRLLPFLGIHKYIEILSLLDNEDTNQYIQQLEKKLIYYKNEMPNEIKAKYLKEEEKNDKLDALEACKSYANFCKDKGDLINKNRTLRFEILKHFKLPFMTGMPLIIFVIYFLPLLDSNSNFWFHVPITVIIGTSIILTILVVLEIMYVIWYSIWSNLAKSTLL